MHIQPSDILFEDNHLIIVNKHAGQLSQGDKSGDEPLSEMLKRYIKAKYNKPGDVFLGVVHRLDRPTSGINIFARTTKALTRMNEMLQKKEMKKTYWAITNKLPETEEGTLIDNLIRESKKNITKRVSPKHKKGKEAILHYKLINHRSENFLLEINLETGRHHQIRVQLATRNAPIVGDLKYGYRTPNKDASICLHARRVEFMHPVRQEMIKLEAPLPKMHPWSLFYDV